MNVLSAGKLIGMFSRHSRHVADLLVDAGHYLNINYKRVEVARVHDLEFEEELMLFVLGQYRTQYFKEFRVIDKINQLSNGLREEF